MKNSIQHDAVAWFQQYGTGTPTFVPLGQSSSFDLDLPRVVHKGIGTRGPLDNYRYKSPNVSFKLDIFANGHWTFGCGTLSRTNMAYENYTSGQIYNESLNQKYSALYAPPDEEAHVFNFYSVYQEGFQSGEISQITGYSGYYAKFEDCLPTAINISAQVGEPMKSDFTFTAQDVTLTEGQFNYGSGFNGYYEVVRPQDISVYLSTSGTSGFYEANVNSLSISLPLQYKVLEGFGSNKPIERKLILPAVGSISFDCIPSGFTRMNQKWLEAPDIPISCKILIRAQKLRGGTPTVEDYLVINIPKMYLDSNSFSAGVRQRVSNTFSFTFFEYGTLGSSGNSEGLFFIRKTPDTVYSFYA